MRFELRHVLAATGFVALLAGGMAAVAPTRAADMSVVEKRQALMKDNGKSAKTVSEYLKGNGSAEDVAKAAAEIASNAKAIPELFPPGTSSKEMPKSKAKPVIWTDMAKFKADAQALEDKAMALETAAKSGDKKKIQVAFGDMGRHACGACHGQFREKMEK